MECLDGKPEVRKLIGELAAPRPFLSFEPAAADNDGAGEVLVGPEEGGDILGEMLAVTIHRDSIAEARLKGGAEARLQGIALAAVPAVADEGNCLQRFQFFRRAVIAAIVDDEDIGAIEQGILHDTPDGPYIIIRRDEHADAPFTERPPYIGDIGCWLHETLIVPDR